MMKPTHILVGTLCSIPLISNLGFVGCIGLVGTTLPDIDIKLGIKHRTITHSLITCLVLGLPLYALNSAVGSVFIFNYILHLFLDTMTEMGVPWLYPICKRRFSFKLCKTGGTLDYCLMLLSLCAIGEWFSKI